MEGEEETQRSPQNSFRPGAPVFQRTAEFIPPRSTRLPMERGIYSAPKQPSSNGTQSQRRDACYHPSTISNSPQTLQCRGISHNCNTPVQAVFNPSKLPPSSNTTSATISSYLSGSLLRTPYT